MSNEEFHQKFKVGDHLAGWGTGKVVRITAIGKTRFLYEDTGRFERVAKIENPVRNWTKATLQQIEHYEESFGKIGGKL